MANSGIDYGMGQTNIDTDTGIRYGVISCRDLASFAWDEIIIAGTDLDHDDAIDNLKSELSTAIKSVLTDYSCSFNSEEIAESIIDDLDLNIESTGDCTRYQYSKDGLVFNVCSDGDIFVTESPFYALCSFCSPCAPGAGHLTTGGSVKTYCLGPDWFDSDHPMPYQCFSVADNFRVTA